MWLLLLTYGCNEAGEFNIDEQFFTKDQQGQMLYNKGQKLKAAETFQSGSLKSHKTGEKRLDQSSNRSADYKSAASGAHGRDGASITI